MMYEIEKMPSIIDIGYTGEIDFRTVQIDMTAWVEKVPAASPILMYVKPGEHEPYPVDITYEDNIITWSVTDEDLGTREGTGLLQVWFGVRDEDQVLRKMGMSAVVATMVHLSLAGEGHNTSTVQIPWLTEITEIKNAVLGYDYEAEAWAVGQRGGEDVSSDDPAYHNNAKYYAGQAMDEASDSEAYGAGTRGGADVDEDDPAYENNSKYFAEQAEEAKTAAEAAQAAAETAAQTDLVAWLEQNITNPDSPPLDRTLSSSSSATPADITGELKSAINNNIRSYLGFDIQDGATNTELGAVYRIEYFYIDGPLNNTDLRLVVALDVENYPKTIMIAIPNDTRFVLNYDSTTGENVCVTGNTRIVMKFDWSKGNPWLNNNYSTSHIVVVQTGIYNRVGKLESAVDTLNTSVGNIQSEIAVLDDLEKGQEEIADSLSYNPDTNSISNNNYILLSKSLTRGKLYNVVVTAGTTGTYTIKSSKAPNAAGIVDTLLTNGSFTANTPKGILYIPTDDGINRIRISSDSISWSVSVYEVFNMKNLFPIGKDISSLLGIADSVNYDEAGKTSIVCNGKTGLSSGSQNFGFQLKRSNISGRYFYYDYVGLRWNSTCEYKDISNEVKVFANSSFTFTGAVYLNPGVLYNVDEIMSGFGSNATIFITEVLSSSYYPDHITQEASTWTFDPCDIVIRGSVILGVNQAFYKSLIASSLENGMTGEKIAERLGKLEAWHQNDYALIAYGDSLTEGAGATDTNHNYLSICRIALGALSRAAYGFGGSASKEIAFTAGAMSGYIPPNTRTFAIKFADLTTNVQIQRTKLNNQNVLIDDVIYKITQTDATTYTLPNSYIPVNYYKEIVVRNSRRTADIYIIWIGTNDSGMQWDVINAMIEKLPHKNYVVMGLTRLGTDTSLEDEQKGYTLYGSHYFNTRVQIINNAFQIIGKTPTAEDTTAMNSGLMPPSLLADSLHFNDDGYEAIGKLLAQHIKALGYYYQKSA